MVRLEKENKQAERTQERQEIMKTTIEIKFTLEWTREQRLLELQGQTEQA